MEIACVAETIKFV